MPLQIRFPVPPVITVTGERNRSRLVPEMRTGVDVSRNVTSPSLNRQICSTSAVPPPRLVKLVSSIAADWNPPLNHTNAVPWAM